MSFFRNIRTSITRGKSSSRDTTPVRNSRPGSMISNATGRRDSMDSRADSIFNRSDTFILGSDLEDKNHSNTSTLEKKSKKSKVLSKFSTFTKRKKTPSPDSSAFEHHPSDNATNTYYKWQSEGPATLDYDARTDPFNFLYEQHSSLKTLQNVSGGSGASSATESVRSNNSINSNNAKPTFDSSTYKKGKMPTHLKEQLEQLKTQTNRNLREEESPERDSDKYKTVTLNSFRKSFRDQFLQKQKDVAYNPAWFVEVDPPLPPSHDERLRRESKENRPDFLVFDNENYRPESRSPIRERSERISRATTRSPVKRNETFRVERSPYAADSRAHNHETTSVAPSIRIEIKNSITPNTPGRMVPVGVAKPMPSQYNTTPYYQQQQQQRAPTAYESTRYNEKNATSKNWAKLRVASPTRPPVSAAYNNTGRYQTLVQIRNETNTKPMQSTPFAPTRSRLSTRIQLGDSSTSSPKTQKRLTSATSKRYSSTVPQNAPNYLSSYQIIKNSTPLTEKAVKQPPYSAQSKHTYFGDSQMQTTSSARARLSAQQPAKTGGYLGNYTVVNEKPQQQQQPSHMSASGGNFLSRRNQQFQQRIVVPLQRRSRSPIKMPWR